MLSNWTTGRDGPTMLGAAPTCCMTAPSSSKEGACAYMLGPKLIQFTKKITCAQPTERAGQSSERQRKNVRRPVMRDMNHERGGCLGHRVRSRGQRQAGVGPLTPKTIVAQPAVARRSHKNTKSRVTIKSEKRRWLDGRAGSIWIVTRPPSLSYPQGARADARLAP